jgi:tetratricopeptide (TPR) repeat protein
MQTPDSDKAANGHSDSPDPMELLRLGLSARQQGDPAGALRLLEAASLAAPQKPNILVEIANTLRGMSRLDEAEAIYIRVLDRTPQHFGGLVGLGHVAKLRADHPGALTHFEAAARANPQNINIRVEIGNTLREMGRLEDAQAVYGRAIEQEPANVGALLGLGYVTRERTQWSVALEHFEAAAAVRPADPNIKLEIAYTLRAMSRLDEAEATCRRILNQVSAHVGALVVLGTIARQQQHYASALAFLEKAAAADPSKPDVQAEIGNVLREMDRPAEAEVVYRSILDHRPGHVSALLGLGFVARQRGDWPVALAHFEAAAAVRPQDLSLQLEVARTLCDMHRLEESEASYLKVLESSPGHDAALLGLGFVARQRIDWPAALAHFEAAAAANPGNSKPQLEIASALRDLLRVDEAEAILRSLEESPAAKTDTDLQVRKLEHFCTTLQLEKAAECLAAWGGHRNIPAAGVTLAASLYAARGQWQEVVDLFRERVVERGWNSRMGDVLLEAVARAARATGKYAEVLTLIEGLPEARTNPAILNLRDQLIEELRLLNSVGALNPGDGPAPDIKIESPFRAWRAGLLSRILAQPDPPEKADLVSQTPAQQTPAQPASQAKLDRTVYLCTDRNYLPGAVVALSSLLRHNSKSLRDYSIRVYCSDDILDFASLAFGEIAAASSIQIDLRPSTSLFSSSGSGLRTGWGIFTPGHALSEAAYYRIYAALQLLDEGVEGRALYLDSDICVGPHLDQFFEFDLGEQPLGARSENPSLVEIRRATLRLGVTPGTYFNSGVLLFDLSHPKLAAALRHAIDVSLNQKHLLTFVDQCALNLAFQGIYASLPEAFNLYVRQDTEAGALPPNPVVRHFLQRPKPWDPMYWSANSTPWFDEFAALAQLLDSSMLKRLLALQFPIQSYRPDRRPTG